ncbi:sugar ABC transporter ATP-binding protein [Larkinella rosea]|uniref:Sugar ABC transporter ATP-binding protein n=1 Tax=Larkinella rosea TaxID=2025312 RepID=A0A3P1BTQ8_9BACT|nr:sugar ABC transporter ATP-binding protein [Larkinella rosea]RRB04293.1 sugar ABC transporter ATP-binding protein [Larkinella rosea]
MLLQLLGISKYFPGVRALENVSLAIQAGEVHALCGENGAGKSTLMGVLTGNLQADEGELIWKGETVVIRGPAHATQLGIAIVYQQLSLVDSLSVAENIFANRPPRTFLGLIDYSALYQKTNHLLEALNLTSLRAKTRVSELSPGQKQMVEIAKALSQNPDLLILDEPTASITEQETQTLFRLIRQLKSQGRSVIYISHRLSEIFSIADRVSVLKDGIDQGTFPIAEVTTDLLVKKMVGRELRSESVQSTATPEVLLEVQSISGSGFEEISFRLHKGEMLGLAGLVGAGRTEIARALFGAKPVKTGRILLNDKPITITHPADAMRFGIGYIPEERKSEGLFSDRSIDENVVSVKLTAARRGRWYNAEQAETHAATFTRQLRIASYSPKQIVRTLSGGNQQKVVLAKWLLSDPQMLIIDEPTHGIDVGAKAEIYTVLRKLAASGKGILLISSELPELLALSDRILVIRQGRLAGELNRSMATEENVMALATGA